MEKKKENKAVALSYDPVDQAPRVIASGKGYVADKIIETGKDSKVPVYQDEKLTNTLSKLEIGDYIPKELYTVVADIMMFVDDCDKIKQKLGRAK
ncbi:flagellar biosynthesis protein FlhB [Lachnospiraceae bacterium KM106-2]|nr:flagellar biosynthesis protein FlhB [Lachnospiraceae bacterium KM106-2]